MYVYDTAGLLDVDEATTSDEGVTSGMTAMTGEGETPATAIRGNNTTTQLTTGTSTATAGLGVAETVEGGSGSSVDSRVIAGLGAAAVVVVLALVLAIGLWIRRRRLLNSATAMSQHVTGKSHRVTRGASASRLDRSTSRGTVRTRRSRAPTAGVPIQAYGETSLAVPGEGATQYAQTSLYPAPGSVRT